LDSWEDDRRRCREMDGEREREIERER
jgi:hypothetical protein